MPRADLGSPPPVTPPAPDAAPSDPGQPPPAATCGLTSLPAEGTTIAVRTAAELASAVSQANAQGSTAIVLEDGTYQVSSMLMVTGDGVTVRSRSGDRSAVVLRGGGMSGSVSHIFNVTGRRFTLAHVTVGWVKNHAVQIHGENDADQALFQDVRFVDTGEQMLKISYDAASSVGADDGVVEGCLFEYTAGVGPQYYIGGVDAHNAARWRVSGNVFRGIRSPDSQLAEFAIHFWSDSRQTRIEGNLISNCDRGIGLGMSDRGHGAALVRNNMVHTTADVGISLESCHDAEVFSNSLYTENYAWSIEYRFAATVNVTIRNNLANAGVRARDGATGTASGNLATAAASWFVDAAHGDLHLAGAGPAAVVDQGLSLSVVDVDFDCQARPRGGGPEIGADEL